MIALIIFFGFLIIASAYLVISIVLLIVAYIRFKKGKLTQEDLDKATKFCKENREERKRKRLAGYHKTMRSLGLE